MGKRDVAMLDKLAQTRGFADNRAYVAWLETPVKERAEACLCLANISSPKTQMRLFLKTFHPEMTEKQIRELTA